MLQRLYVKNVALISEAEVIFDEKLNILSGETGSGKSVILDSINFVLGSKADKTMIRYGEREAIVRAEFLVNDKSAALEVLKDMDIESDGEIIITRKFNTDGKGGIKVNGNAVTAAMLKQISSRLVDVHGQSEHFFLLDAENQLKVIDGVCGGAVEDLKAEIAAEIEKKRDLKKKIASLGGDETERERRLDLLNYQIKEIENAAVREGEFDELSERRNVIMNTEKIMQSLGGASGAFSGDGGISDLLSAVKRQISAIAGYSAEYEKLYGRIEALALESEDISETLTDCAESLSFDAGEAEEIENRLTLLKALKKKYGATEAEILAFLEDARAQYEALSDGAALAEKYAAELEKCDKNIFGLCRKLTAERKKTADKLCGEVVAELKGFNIPDAAFEVEFDDYDFDTANLNSANGSDAIRFLFSANKGEPLKPLSKVISGGEMSRFMLAIKTCLKDVNGISTYIFDEIDAGISGFTAMTVAKKFVEIAGHTQIIAVSHLPQVCAASDSQYLIYKEEEDGKTLTHVKKLTAEEKVGEIVRLAGSVKSAAAEQHARELIAQFKN